MTLLLPLPSSLLFNNHSSKFTNANFSYIPFPFRENKKSYHLTTCTASNSQNEVAQQTETETKKSLSSELMDGRLLSEVSAAKDANEVLDMIAQKTNKISGILSSSDCGLIIGAALDRKNADLALSVFSSMRSSTFDPEGTVRGDKDQVVERWIWSRPNVQTYKLLAQGLAASLRVSDAIKIIGYVCRVGASPGEEVSFGKVIKCPSCKVAVAVAQPQHGIQACTFIGNMFIACECKGVPKVIHRDI